MALFLSGLGDGRHISVGFFFVWGEISIIEPNRVPWSARMIAVILNTQGPFVWIAD